MLAYYSYSRGAIKRQVDFLGNNERKSTSSNGEVCARSEKKVVDFSVTPLGFAVNGHELQRRAIVFPEFFCLLSLLKNTWYVLRTDSEVQSKEKMNDE
jgi:hypothetical protein